jgi:hypothetical protein
MRYRVGHSVKIRLNQRVVNELSLRVVDVEKDRLRLHVPYREVRGADAPFLHVYKSEVLEHYGVDKNPQTEDIGNDIREALLPEGADPELPSLIDKKIVERDIDFFLGLHVKWYYEVVDGARLETEGYILRVKLTDEDPVFVCSEMFCSQPSRYWVVSPYVVDYLLPST